MKSVLVNFVNHFLKAGLEQSRVDGRVRGASRKSAKRVPARGASRPQPPKNYRPLIIKGFGLLAVVVVAVTGLALYEPAEDENFTIRTIEITGNREFLSNAQVTRALQKHADGDFFNLNIESARSALLSLPWVKEVSLRREWPDKLVIVLTEQKAVARWADLKGNKALVNEQADVFAGLPEAVDLSLPQLVGPQNKQQRVLQEYAEISKQLKAVGHSVDSLKMDARNTWEMLLANGIKVRYLERNKDAALERLLIALNVFEKERDLEQVAQFDLRYSNGFAVSWKEEQSDV